jgi:hypothetical protein
LLVALVAEQHLVVLVVLEHLVELPHLVKEMLEETLVLLLEFLVVQAVAELLLLAQTIIPME